MKVPLPVRAVPFYATRAWFTPPPLSDRRRQQWEQTLHGTEPIVIDVDGRTLTGFRHGEGPLVFLVHGWGGRAAQMGQLGRSLADLGFSVVAVDAPGHGEQEWDRSDIFQMSSALDEMVHRFGEPEAVVAHSLGAMAAVYAFHGRIPSRLILLAPMLDVSEALDTFAARARLFPWTTTALKRRIRRFCGDSWSIFSAGSQTDFGDAEVLVIHDPADPDTRFEASAALTALRERTHLVVAEGRGHNGILTDEGMADEVARFLLDHGANRLVADPARTG